MDGQPPHDEPIGVIAGTTTTLALQYDVGATIPVEFEHRIGSSSTFKAAKIDSVYPSTTRRQSILLEPK